MNYSQDFYILSATSLAIFKECPRCFYLQVKEKIKRPQGPPPTLHIRMDELIKDYFDKYRVQDKLPPQVQDKIQGKLFSNIDLLNKWRDWQTSLFYEDKELKAKLVGALDDCVISDDNFFVPLDYKTKGIIREDSHIYHQSQLDIYTFLLEENGYPTNGTGYLVFFAPSKIEDDNHVRFDIEVRKMETLKENAKELFQKAILLLHGPIPKKHTECEYCRWTANTHGL